MATSAWLSARTVPWLTELWLAPTAQGHESDIPHIASLRKDPNKKFEVVPLNVYGFWTIVNLENLKLNHHKSGTTYKFLMP